MTAGTLVLFALLLTYVPQLSGFGAGALKAALGIAGLVVVDVWVLRQSNTYVQIVQEKNVAYAIMLLAYALILAATLATAQPVPAQLVDRTGARIAASGVPHLDTALAYVGTRETRGRPNRGGHVDRFARLGARMEPPISWCAAFTSYVLRAVGRDVTDTRGVSVLGAVATRHITSSSIDARGVQRGAARPPVGSLVIWRRGATWQGHIGFVVQDDVHPGAWRLRCGRTVEGNTSSGATGSQADGDGVYRRQRCIEPGAYFRIVAFTPA